MSNSHEDHHFGDSYPVHDKPYWAAEQEMYQTGRLNQHDAPTWSAQEYASSFDGASTFDGALNFGDSPTFDGNSTLNDTPCFDDGSTFDSSLFFYDTPHADGNLNFNSSPTFDGSSTLNDLVDWAEQNEETEQCSVAQMLHEQHGEADTGMLELAREVREMELGLEHYGLDLTAEREPSWTGSAFKRPVQFPDPPRPQSPPPFPDPPHFPPPPYAMEYHMRFWNTHTLLRADTEIPTSKREEARSRLARHRIRRLTARRYRERLPSPDQMHGGYETFNERLRRSKSEEFLPGAGFRTLRGLGTERMNRELRFRRMRQRYASSTSKEVSDAASAKDAESRKQETSCDPVEEVSQKFQRLFTDRSECRDSSKYNNSAHVLDEMDTKPDEARSTAVEDCSTQHAQVRQAQYLSPTLHEGAFESLSDPVEY